MGEPMDEIVVVTAFFDIGRGDFKRNQRSREKYLQYFRHWARLQNRLIVYTDAETAEYVEEVRREFGLSDRTEVIIVDDVTLIEPDLFAAMSRVASDPFFVEFRRFRNAPSNNPKYSYLMFLKSWFIADAARRLQQPCFLAWIDFGFDHGGSVYPDSTDFAFEWRHEFEEKIHFFVIGDGDSDFPVFEVVRRMSDCFMGATFIVPSHWADFFLHSMKDALEDLIHVGFIDDDQLLMLMAYRSAPDRFELHSSDWFLPIREFGGRHMRVREPRSVGGLKQFFRVGVRQAKMRRDAFGNAARLYRNLVRH